MAEASGKGPKATAEGAFFDLATSSGWEVTKRGWPDFFMEKDGKVSVVEVQTAPGRGVNADRARVLQALARHGIPAYVWTPQTGFERIDLGVEPGGKGGGGNEEQEDATQDQPLPGKGSGGTRAEVQTVACPTCQAEPGEPCVGRRGPRTSNHIERVHAYGEAGGTTTTEQINQVWGHYVAVMSPRGTIAGEDDRKLIRAALQVATVRELCRAIDGCAASDFHMGANDRRRKYNRLSQVIKGRQGRETTRERVDYFIDIADKAGKPEAHVPSASAAVISKRKTDVQRGWRFSDDEEAVKAAQESEAWLAQRGIKTVRGEDGYPTFRADRGDET